MNPESERIRGYLQQQAAEKTVEQLIERVEEGVAELMQAAATIDRNQLGQHPEGDEWSPADCIRHIAETNIEVGRQVLHVAWTGGLPTEPAESAPQDFDALLAKMRESLDSLYAHVREADPGANLEVKWKHPMFGDLNWREWLLFLRIHSKDHARQLGGMAEALA
jgi:S-formylglutathione hydrolase FrmB